MTDGTLLTSLLLYFLSSRLTGCVKHLCGHETICACHQYHPACAAGPLGGGRVWQARCKTTNIDVSECAFHPSNAVANCACRMSLQVVLMDHMDWLDAAAAKTVADELARAVQPGGRIIWRSAAMIPPYNQYIAAAGFQASPAILLWCWYACVLSCCRHMGCSASGQLD